MYYLFAMIIYTIRNGAERRVLIILSATSKWKWCQTAFNFLGRDLAAPAGGHWVGAVAEIAARVRIPVTDGINILTLLN